MSGVARDLQSAVQLTPSEITGTVAAMNRLQKQSEGGSQYVEGSGADLLAIVNAMQGQ